MFPLSDTHTDSRSFSSPPPGRKLEVCPGLHCRMAYELPMGASGDFVFSDCFHRSREHGGRQSAFEVRDIFELLKFVFQSWLYHSLLFALDEFAGLFICKMGMMIPIFEGCPEN